jgi:nicotinamide riboside kinase
MARIGLCGTVSCGKTTLVNALKDLPQFEGYKHSTERSKYLRDLGIPLNTDSTVLGQFMFLAERTSELFNENLITDRTIWDVCAFTLSAKSIDWPDKEKIIVSSTLLMPFYDIVFYVSPEGVPIEDNGVRTIDADYRDKIDMVIRELLKEYPPKKLVNISGSVEDRIKQITEAISL